MKKSPTNKKLGRTKVGPGLREQKGQAAIKRQKDAATSEKSHVLQSGQIEKSGRGTPGLEKELKNFY